MALATRCPHCATTFRVAHDQLKLRAGLVRCGACKQIFNGVENLLGPDMPPPKPASAVTPPQPPITPRTAPPLSPKPHLSVPVTPNAGMPATAGSASPDSLRLSPPTTAFPSSTLTPPAVPDEADKDVDPLTRMTLMDFTFFEEGQAPIERREGTLEGAMTRVASDTEAPDEIEQAIEDLKSRPWRDEHARAATEKTKRAADDDKDEPGFVKNARRRQKVGGTLKWVYGLGSFLLVLALAGQLAYSFRDQLAQRVPQSAPYLQQACAYLGCSIAYPAPINSLAIESSELQAIPAQANTFLLRVLLRNRYDTTVTWPHLELTLNDGDEKPVARRSFTPADYLPAADQVQAGFAAQTEQAVALRFVLENEKASGFQVYLFYP